MRLLFITIIWLILCSPIYVIYAKEDYHGYLGTDMSVQVSQEVMQTIYQEVKTPYKYGIVLHGEDGKKIDCPSIFRYRDNWYMVYIIFNENGYETALAKSDDLLNWEKLGKILTFKEETWDANQAAGYITLQDHKWGGSYELQQYAGRYWMSYLGGALKGYETDPLSIGIAWTDTPNKPSEWHRIKENPVLNCNQPDTRDFEKQTLYKSHIIYDKQQRLGYPFVMFYNGKQKGDWIERIGTAVSKDMIHWLRYGDSPVIDNYKGISGDPQITKIGNIWVMFYFGAFWQPKAFDTFACSYDLVNWTKWQGPHLIEPSEPWDEKYAHKPWVIKYEGIVYHFYCAVGDQGRVIALATSKDLLKDDHNINAVKEIDVAEFPAELVNFIPYKRNPVFCGTGKDTWDKNIRERGYILRQNGTYHLWYTGYNDDSSDTKFLGYATSNDGLNWTRYPDNPIFKKSWVEDMQVVKYKDIFYMFAEGRNDIAHMLTSPDGIHWRDQGDLDIRKTSGEPIDAGPYGTPFVWIEKEKWFLFYERDDSGIWLAVSTDGKVWKNIQDDPVICTGPDQYDRHAVALNQIIKYKGKYYAYYHASAFMPWRDWTTNVAMSLDLVHWVKYPLNPIITGDKSSGILVNDGTQYRLYTMHPDVRVYFPRKDTER